jgi:hypothetical protein
VTDQKDDKRVYVKVPDNFATMTDEELDAFVDATYEHFRAALSSDAPKEPEAPPKEAQ